MKKISDIMDKNYNVVTKKSLVSEVYDIIKKSNIDTTIVIDNQRKPIGIVTIWNLISAKASGFPFNKTPVEEIMSFPVVTIFEEEAIKDAARMMLRNRIKNVIVINQYGVLSGLINAKKILECFECLTGEEVKIEIETLYKIAIIGGTGKQGRGLALRWAKVGHEILIGSRNKLSAETISGEIKNNLKTIGVDAKVGFGTNKEVTKDADIIVLTVPYASLSDLILDIKDSLKDNQIVISPIVPIIIEDGEIGTTQTRIAAAEKISLMTRVLGVDVVAAFHTIPATNLSKIEFPLNFDVVVCGDNDKAKQKVMMLVSQIPNLRPLDGGSLKRAVTLEYLTSLAIQIGRKYKKTTIGLKFI